MSTPGSRRRGAPLLAVAALVGGLAALGAAAPPASAHDDGPASIPLPNGWFGEDIANGRGSSFFVGSLSTGGIYKGDYETGRGSVLVASAPA